MLMKILLIVALALSATQVWANDIPDSGPCDVQSACNPSRIYLGWTGMSLWQDSGMTVYVDGRRVIWYTDLSRSDYEALKNLLREAESQNKKVAIDYLYFACHNHDEYFIPNECQGLSNGRSFLDLTR